MTPYDWIDILSVEDKLTLSVIGKCMSGVIDEGSRITIGSSSYYWPGDVIVFPQGKHLLVHRVIGLYRNGGLTKVLTQADQGLGPDKSIFYKDVIGKVLVLNDKSFLVSLKIRLLSLLRFLWFVLKHCFRSTRQRMDHMKKKF